MNISKHNVEIVWFWSGAILFLVSLLLGYYIQQPLLVLAAFLPPLLFLFFKDVRIGFYALLFSIPISINLEETLRVGVDFPDEPLMLLLTASFLFFVLYNFNKINWTYLRNNPLVILVLASFIWTAISVLYSENPILSSKYLIKKIWYLIPFFFFPILFFTDTKVLIRSVQLLLIPMLLLILLITYRHSLVGFSFEKTHDPLQPFFQNHVMYGSILSCLLPVSVGAIMLSRKLSIQWLFSLFLLVCILVGVYLAYSRAAWMAVLFSVMAYFFSKWRLMHFAMLGFYVLVGSGVYWLSNQNKFLDFKPKFEKTIMHESLEDHIMATIQGTDLSSAERYYRWIASIRMAKDRPLTGVGPNNFYDYYKSYTVVSFRTWVSRNPERSTTHNYFLFMLTEQGIPAMILYAILIIAIFWYGQKVYHQSITKRDQTIVLCALSLVAAVFINNFFSELLERDKIGSLFYLSLAAIISVDYRNKTLKTQAPL